MKDCTNCIHCRIEGEKATCAKMPLNGAARSRKGVEKKRGRPLAASQADKSSAPQSFCSCDSESGVATFFTRSASQEQSNFARAPALYISKINPSPRLRLFMESDQSDPFS